MKLSSVLKKASGLLIISLVFGYGCVDRGSDLLDLAVNPPSRQPIDLARTGVNNFFVDREFGTIPEQYSEIRNTLGLRFIRVLFAWTDPVQPSPNSPLDYSFYDAIVRSIPPGVDILPVVVHTPSWMSDSRNWIGGDDARGTWIESWLRPTIERYAGVPGIVGWQVWNEPNAIILPSDAGLELDSPLSYFDLLARSTEVIRTLDPTKTIVFGATESIQQSGGSNLRYNEQLRDMGAENLVDVWAIHYYGEQFERVIQRGGVADFVNSLSTPVWITESGARGPDNQLSYVERVWPFLDERMPGKFQRFYYYQFGETVPPEENFGLRMNGPVFVSDLYLSLSGGG